jgi:hypothetical protein
MIAPGQIVCEIDAGGNPAVDRGAAREKDHLSRRRGDRSRVRSDDDACAALARPLRDLLRRSVDDRSRTPKQRTIDGPAPSAVICYPGVTPRRFRWRGPPRSSPAKTPQMHARHGFDRLPLSTPRWRIRPGGRRPDRSVPRGAEPMRLYATPLVPHSAGQHPLSRLDFFEADGRLSIAAPSARGSR